MNDFYNQYLFFLQIIMSILGLRGSFHKTVQDVEPGLAAMCLFSLKQWNETLEPEAIFRVMKDFS